MSYNHAMIRIHEPYRNDEPDEPDGHQAPDINDRQTNDSNTSAVFSNLNEFIFNFYLGFHYTLARV